MEENRKNRLPWYFKSALAIAAATFGISGCSGSSGLPIGPQTVDNANAPATPVAYAEYLSVQHSSGLDKIIIPRIAHRDQTETFRYFGVDIVSFAGGVSELRRDFAKLCTDRGYTFSYGVCEQGKDVWYVADVVQTKASSGIPGASRVSFRVYERIDTASTDAFLTATAVGANALSPIRFSQNKSEALTEYHRNLDNLADQLTATSEFNAAPLPVRQVVAFTILGALTGGDRQASDWITSESFISAKAVASEPRGSRDCRALDVRMVLGPQEVSLLRETKLSNSHFIACEGAKGWELVS